MLFFVDQFMQVICLWIGPDVYVMARCTNNERLMANPSSVMSRLQLTSEDCILS